MAGLIRTLVVAHAQATRNRAQRELGRSGVLAMVIFMMVISATFLVPLFVGMTSIGWVVGKLVLRAPDPATDAVLGLLLFGLSYFGGAMSGTVSGSKHLTWESYRTFPVPLRAVFLAELAASAVDLMPVVLGSATVALSVGLAFARPVLVPFLPLVVLEGVGAVLVTQLLVGALAERAVKRVRVVLGLLALLLALGLVLGALTPESGPVRGDPLALALSLADTLRGPFVTASMLLPTTWAARSFAAALQGHWGWAFAYHLVPITALVGLAALTARLIEREQTHVHEESGAERLWSFRHPVGGIARLQLLTVLGSRVGRFGLVFPLVVVVLIRGPFATLLGRTPWAVPAAFLYVALLGSQFQLNQFGLDAHGTKALLLLPIDEVDLWRGKARGLFAYQAMQAAALGVCFVAVHRPSFAELSSGVLLFFSMTLVENAVGRLTSVLLPRMMPRNRLQANATPLGLILVALTLSLGFGGAVGTGFAVLAQRAPAWRPVVALALLGGAAVAREVLFPLAARLLRTRRETLLKALG